jgi:hypothetical protein
MDIFGRIRLAFEPPEDDCVPSIEMTISGEADLSQMASFFDSFLKANGYLYEGDIEIGEKKKENPWSYYYGHSMTESPQATDFISSTSFGLEDSESYVGSSSDTISLV